MDESNVLKTNIELEEENIKKNIRINIKKIREISYLIVKRLFDLFGSLIGLILLSPIFMIVIILIKLEDNGNSLFIQERIGKNGKIFKLYKFRSMVHNADEILEEMLKDPKIRKEYKKNMKLTQDPRITKIGNVIRKTSIDELPQLINVLKGDMSLIGNRPYLPREKQDMEKYYDDIIKTKPGLTGYWQVNGRSKTTFEERCQLERYYSNHLNLLLDIKIFFRTFYVVFKRKGAE